MPTVTGKIIVNTTANAEQLTKLWTEGARGGHSVVRVRFMGSDSEKVGLYSLVVKYTAKTKVSIDDIAQRSEIVFGFRHAVTRIE